MERLTQKSDKMIWFKDRGLKIEPCEMNSHHCRMILEKLATYEDLEEQGLLVRLPVPLGSKVYWISTRDKQNPIIFEKIFVLGMLYFWDSTVFATREEAEKKLEEMKKNG